MTSHKDHRLDQLGIAAQDEADELQRELGIRFDQFSYHDRKVWNQQNSYLQAHARTRTVSDSADMAGVTVSTAQAWKYLDTLGFTRRLEVADLRFSDSLQVTALERAREPDAPASLLIALLRAHIPEKYSANGHLCDTSKSDELLFHYRQDAQRELAAGHPTLRAIANGTYQPPHNSPSHPNLSSAEGDNEHPNLSPHGGENTTKSNLSPHRGENTTESNISPHGRENTTKSDLSPHGGENTTKSDLSPHGGETQRGGSFPATPYDSEETTSDDDYPPIDPEEFAHFNLSPTEEDTAHPNLSETDQPSVGADFKPAHDLSPAGRDTAHPHLSPTEEDTAHPHLSPTGGETQRGGTPHHPAPSTQNPSGLNRRQRRQLQRQSKRKHQNSKRPRAPNIPVTA